MVLVVAATAYLVGLQPALFVALLGWAFGRIRRILATDRERRLEAFRDNWSRRFHSDLFATVVLQNRREHHRSQRTGQVRRGAQSAV